VRTVRCHRRPDKGCLVERTTASQNRIFNLIERAVPQTGLTRPTVNAFFRRMRPDKKCFFLQNRG
jgi:hypothetical protein